MDEGLTNSFSVAFAQFAPSNSDAKALSTLPLQKIVYVLCNVMTLALGLWKCRSMGLLPTGTGDWLAFETRGPVSSIFFFRIVNIKLTYLACARNLSAIILYHLNSNSSTEAV